MGEKVSGVLLGGRQEDRPLRPQWRSSVCSNSDLMPNLTITKSALLRIYRRQELEVCVDMPLFVSHLDVLVILLMCVYHLICVYHPQAVHTELPPPTMRHLEMVSMMAPQICRKRSLVHERGCAADTVRSAAPCSLQVMAHKVSRRVFPVCSLVSNARKGQRECLCSGVCTGHDRCMHLPKQTGTCDTLSAQCSLRPAHHHDRSTRSTPTQTLDARLMLFVGGTHASGGTHTSALCPTYRHGTQRDPP